MELETGEPKQSPAQDEKMLILTRKVDQGIVIQGNIVVRVLGIERDRVKLGIAADNEIIILREELCQDGRDDRRSSPKVANG
jgi:carbon storage regulator